MDAEDFPHIARIDEGPSIELNAATLRRTIDRVEFAAATDDSRPVITGVSIKGEEGKLTFAASDGFRLAVSDIQLEASQSFPVGDLNLIVPARALREVGRLIGDGASPVELRVNEKQTQVQFSMTDVELVAQPIQGTFPNYNQLIPGEYNTVTVVDVDDFMRGARIAAIFARDGSGIVRLQVQPAADGSSGKLVISARADEVGDNEGEIDVKVEGEPSKIAFNSPLPGRRAGRAGRRSAPGDDQSLKPGRLPPGGRGRLRARRHADVCSVVINRRQNLCIPTGNREIW